MISRNPWVLILALGPIHAEAAACTMAEVTKVGTAADKTSAVIGLMGSNPPCEIGRAHV